jgi:hypothetical protein
VSSDLDRRSPAPPDRTRLEPDDAEPSLAILANRLIEDGRDLVRQEIALAKAEAVDTVTDYARGGALVAIGGLSVLIGLMVLLAFLVIALGVLLEDRYWLSALIVGLLFAGAGALTIWRGKARLRADRLVPEETIESLRATADWAADQARRFRND